MTRKEAIKELARDFKRWGIRAVRRVLEKTLKHGTVTNQWVRYHAVTGKPLYG